MVVLGSCCNACLTPRRARHFGHIYFFHKSQNFSVLVFARTPVLLHLLPAYGAIRGTRENPRCHLVSSVASELPNKTRHVISIRRLAICCLKNTLPVHMGARYAADTIKTQKTIQDTSQ